MILFLPIIIPLIFVALLIMLRKNLHVQKWLSALGVLLQLCVSIAIFLEVRNSETIVLQAGNWPAPFGISFFADYTSAIVLMAVSFVAFWIHIFSFGAIDATRQKFGLFVLFQGLLMGINGALLTADVFNLYVWFEVMLISSFVLISLGATKAQLRGAVKYVVMNLFGSALFVSAIGIVYGQLGTLNMADIALKINQHGLNLPLNSAMMLFFIAFGIKAAVFPFYFWLPSSYPAPPVAITAFLSATLTKVGVYVLIRFYSLFAFHQAEFWQPVIYGIAAITMVSGVIMAASAYDIRKILSFHIISQIGYMIMGLGVFSVFGLAGALYFLVHNMLSKTTAFMSAGLMQQQYGTFDLKKMGNLYRSHPYIAFLFLIPALSLAGIPPTSGFFGKLLLIFAGLSAGAWLVTVSAVVVSIFTLFSMIKIWNEAIWKPRPENLSFPAGSEMNKTSIFATSVMAFSSLLFGFAIAWLFDAFVRAGEQLINNQHYINAILNQ